MTEIKLRQSARSEKMTKDMHAYARQTPLNIEEAEIGPTLHELREEPWNEFRDKGVHLACQCDDGVDVEDLQFTRQRL